MMSYDFDVFVTVTPEWWITIYLCTWPKVFCASPNFAALTNSVLIYNIRHDTPNLIPSISPFSTKGSREEALELRPEHVCLYQLEDAERCASAASEPSQLAPHLATKVILNRVRCKRLLCFARKIKAATRRIALPCGHSRYGMNRTPHRTN